MVFRFSQRNRHNKEMFDFPNIKTMNLNEFKGVKTFEIKKIIIIMEKKENK